MDGPGSIESIGRICGCCFCCSIEMRLCGFGPFHALCPPSSCCVRPAVPVCERSRNLSLPFRYPKSRLSSLRGPVRHSVLPIPVGFHFFFGLWLSTPNGALATRVTPQRNAQEAAGPALHQTCRPSHLECHGHAVTVSVVDSNRVPLLDGWYVRMCKHFKSPSGESRSSHAPLRPAQPRCRNSVSTSGIRCQSLAIVAPCNASQPPCPCCAVTAAELSVSPPASEELLNCAVLAGIQCIVPSPRMCCRVVHSLRLYRTNDAHAETLLAADADAVACKFYPDP